VADANGNLFTTRASLFTVFFVLVLVVDRGGWGWSAIRFGLARDRGSDGTYRTYGTDRL
jgi:hypothetical protein